MVDIASKTSHTHGSAPGVGLQRREDPSLTKPLVVRVRATHEKYRKALKHGVTHKRFLPDINQSVEWPNDTFTHRRLKEGSVVLDEGDKREPEPQKIEAAPQAKKPEPAPAPAAEQAKT